MTPPHHGAMRIGRVMRWQRWSSYLVLGACAATGLVWFVLLDGFDWPPPRLVAWWIGHGASGFLVLVAIGMALPHHVQATWKHRRNRWLGGTALAALVLLALSALLLEYGREPWHAAMHWLHVGVGVAALAVFPWHVLRGRRSVGRRPPR